MIADHDNTTLISSMGWVDHADLWVFDVAGDRERRVSLNSAARYLEVHGGTGGYFSVAHHFDGPRFDVTVHAFAEPSHPVARASVTEEAWKIDGELAAWRNVPLLYVPFIALPGLKDFMLLTIDPDRGKVEAEKLDWYDDAYDKGYQGVVAVDRIPETDLAVFSVQRSSDLVLYDLNTRKKKGVLSLERRHGNPRLLFRGAKREAWASDYDTLVVISLETLSVLRSRRLQDAAQGTGQFIGDFAFDAEGSLCAVARPFSGDVVGIDPETLRVKWVAKTGGQPLEVAVLPGRRVVARDWRSGQLLRAKLARKWIPG